MFGFDDPLQDIIDIREYEFDQEEIEYNLTNLRTAMGRLEEWLNLPLKAKIDLAKSGIFYGWRFIPLPEDDLQRVQHLHQRVVERRGQGSIRVEEALLKLIAVSAQSSSILFWLKVVDIDLPRDQFSKKRRKIAFAALYYLAHYCKELPAYKTILELTRHSNEKVQSEAMETLSMACSYGQYKLPPEFLQTLNDIALNDKNYETRFRMRMLLEYSYNALPLENQGGTYCFKVGMYRDNWYRVLELKSEQYLSDLHHAILESIGWDDNNGRLLYSFYMNGLWRDDQFAFQSPYDLEEYEYQNYTTDEIQIGNLALKKNHKFLYLFDYRNEHLFQIKVTSIHSKADAETYPRVIDSEGEPPTQDSLWDDEDDRDDWGDEWDDEEDWD